jgi:hypothetical protein
MALSSEGLKPKPLRLRTTSTLGPAGGKSVPNKTRSVLTNCSKAEWDQDTPAYMAQNLFPKLTGAPYKRYVEIGEGTHTVIMEKNRMNLFREVQLFLDEQHSVAK